eukprot:tig00001292_g8040.t1
MEAAPAPEKENRRFEVVQSAKKAALDLSSVRDALQEIDANSASSRAAPEVVELSDSDGDAKPQPRAGATPRSERDEHGFVRNSKGAWELEGGFQLTGRLYERLYAHQRAGVAWMWGLCRAGSGGCLADDMGLGKTLSSCALLAGLFEAGRQRVVRALVLAPKSLLAHWEKELRAWLGGARVCVYGGGAAAREGALEAVCLRGGVLLTSYGPHPAPGPGPAPPRLTPAAGMASDSSDEEAPPRRRGAARKAKAAPRRRKEEDEDEEEEEEEGEDGGAGGRGKAELEAALASKADVEWDLILCDEGHRLKNPSMKLCQRIRIIRARSRVLLTGTPVQNNLRELWALLDFACEGRLLGDAAAFRREFEAPIARASERDASRAEARLGRERSAALRERIRPHFLRREKATVFGPAPPAPPAAEAPQADEGAEASPAGAAAQAQPTLPTKNDLIVWTELTELQARVYRAFLETPVVREVLNKTKSPLAALTVLKKICDHPRLLARAPRSHAPREGLRAARSVNAVLDALHFERACDIEAAAAQSGKLLFLERLLQELRAGRHRTLVFSQSRRALNLIDALLARKGFRALRVDGSVTDGRERQRRVDAFNKCADYEVFLLTTQTGGLGFTLTGADRVVIFDPSWNPSLDNQAVDRVYRIGQRKPVVVYRLLTCGTIEEKIYRRQIYKGALMLTAMEGPRAGPAAAEKKKGYFTAGELRQLFAFEEGAARTMEQLNREHAAQRRHAPALAAHVERLRALGIAGITDHDLLFSKEEEAAPEAPRPARPASAPHPALYPRPAPFPACSGAAPAGGGVPAGRIGRDFSYEALVGASPSKAHAPPPRPRPAPLPSVPLRPPRPGAVPYQPAFGAVSPLAPGPAPGAVPTALRRRPSGFRARAVPYTPQGPPAGSGPVPGAAPSRAPCRTAPRPPARPRLPCLGPVAAPGAAPARPPSAPAAAAAPAELAKTFSALSTK